MSDVPETFCPGALFEAYRRALQSYAFYVELKRKGDPVSLDEARYLLLGWNEVWDLLDEIGLPVTQDEGED